MLTFHGTACCQLFATHISAVHCERLLALAAVAIVLYAYYSNVPCILLTPSHFLSLSFFVPQALRFATALGRMPSREKDLFLLHSQYHGLPQGDTPNNWNNWYNCVWRMLRWVAAYAARRGCSVDEAADTIEGLPERRNGTDIIHFDIWRTNNIKDPRGACQRLQGNATLLKAWVDSGASVNDGPRRVDKMMLLALGCDVMVY